MSPGSPSPRRLALPACLLAAAAALALSACGSGGGAATAEKVPPTSPKRQAKAAVAVTPCPSQVNAFLNSLYALRRRLAVGLTYKQYAAKIKQLQSAYDGIPVDHLTIGCLATTATPTETAFNRYIEAANDWGECLADASCTTTSIEPVLQRHWRVASGSLSEAQ